MKTKICSKCSLRKPLDEFYKNSSSKDSRQPACKNCMRVCNRHSRRKKHCHYKQVRYQRIQKNRDRFNKWKSEQTCFVCAEDDMSCLDLHHLNPGKKDNSIANVVRDWSWERLEKEIKKCIVLCRNCHAKVHAKRFCLLLYNNGV